MGRLLSLFLLVGALAAPASMNAATVTWEPIDFFNNFCEGHLVHVTGTQVVVEGDNFVNIRSQGLTAVDLTTGTVYSGTAGHFDHTLTTPSGAQLDTFSNVLHLVAAGGESIDLMAIFHATFSPDGTLRAGIFWERITC